MQLKTIAVALFTLLLAAVAAGAPAVPQTGCAALYVTGNELWSISSGGEARLVAQDERGINMPRWSPSGRRIAYVHDFQFGGDRVSDLVVIDSASGESVTTIPIAEERGFNDVLQLGWRGEKSVWTEGHTTPSSGIYYEWDVATGKASNELWGAWFAPAPNGESVAHLAHVAHGAPPERAAAQVMIDDRVVYPAKDDERRHQIAGGFAWSGRDIVFVDRVNGEASVVSVDAARGTVTRTLPLDDSSSVERIEIRPDRRGLVIQSTSGFFEADFDAGRVRALADAPRGLRPMRVDVEGHRLIDTLAAGGARRTVVVEHLRCP